jgi:hypothetical protein
MVFKIYVAAAVLLMLSACGAPEIRRLPDGNAIAPGAPPAAGVTAYRIDTARSELRILVYRAGPLARFGHNHVILNRSVDGWVSVAADAVTGSFALQVPVADFLVDDAPGRAAEGEDFSADVTDDAKAGTRRNMLSAALLDAERFPSITLTSTAIVERAGQRLATLRVNVAGHESTIVVPFALEAFADRIAASGTVQLRQSQLGLVPFNALLGALQVQDEFTVKFTLSAVRA